MELPASVSKCVLDIRKRYDDRLAAFPAEITVAGSSGVGTIAAGQDAHVVLAALKQVANEHLPIHTHFVKISRFAIGPIIWLQPVDPTPFVAIQQALISTNIQFLPHKFGYTPHCSLSARDLAPDEVEALIQESFPRDVFVLSSLALYTVVGGRANFVERLHPGHGPNNSFKPNPLRGSA
jgi:hypothetical protein